MIATDKNCLPRLSHAIPGCRLRREEGYGLSLRTQELSVRYLSIFSDNKLASPGQWFRVFCYSLPFITVLPALANFPFPKTASGTLPPETVLPLLKEIGMASN